MRQAIVMSVKDRNEISSLLLTSASLDFCFMDDCNDDNIGDFARYVRDAYSLIFLQLGITGNLSEAAFTSFCYGVANSSLQTLNRWCRIAREANLEAVAERFALAIAQSSLEAVQAKSRIHSAFSQTTPARNIELVFSQISFDEIEVDGGQTRLKWSDALDLF
jgi:hypothetical protein